MLDNPIYLANLSTPNVPIVLPTAEKTTATEPSLPRFATTTVWGIDYACVTMSQTLSMIDAMIARKKPSTIVTANLNYSMLCDSQPRLREFTKRAELVLCDGMPILWRSRFNAIALPERVAGSDLIYRIAELAAKKGYRLFLMGGDEGVAEQAAKRLVELNPGLEIAGVACPPFRKLSQSETMALTNQVRQAKTDILLVAFGQPKGEYWIEENAAECNAAVNIQLGASFDFIVGKAKRAPVWMQILGLEWLYRAAHDPKRLVPRYAKNAWHLCKVIRRDLLQATR
jgi:N-acetylglucosaminyldiphosphoundecaprenol N-acetyl-beta-D-mannosaminyltransferase